MTRQEFEDHINELEKNPELGPINEFFKKVLWMMNKDLPIETVRQRHEQTPENLRQANRDNL